MLNGIRVEKKEIYFVCGNFPPFENLKELFEFLKFSLMPPKNIDHIQVGVVWQEQCTM
jgi:hypothetical protein